MHFYVWSTKFKKTLTNISLTKLTLTLISTEIFPHLSVALIATHSPPTAPSLHLHPIAARVGREQLFSACGWHVGVLKVRRGGREALLFAQCSTQLPPHQLNEQPLPTNPTELSSPPVLQRAKTELSLNNPQSGFPIFSSFLTNHCQKVIMMSNYSRSCISR